MIRIVKSGAAKPAKRVVEFLSRPAFDPEAERVAAEILKDVRERGDAAVLAAEKRIDGVSLTAKTMRVSAEELAAAEKATPAKVKRGVKEAHRRVAAFAKAGMRPDWSIRTPHGGTLGERFLPFERVGVYVPGGTAPLASTSVMTATLAQVAGVKEIVAITPCAKDGSVNPVLLYALKLAGCTEIYRVGGIQGVGMLAYGTKTVRPVQKLVGPGGAFVTAAKKLVYGEVSLDQVAGPSEICIVADGDADPAWVAADLLSQIEHGTGREKALLVTDSELLANKVAAAVEAQLEICTRKARMAPTIERGGMLIVVAPSIGEAADIASEFAPEHLEVLTKNPRKLLPRLRKAGAIFVGPWAPEPAGDFAAGPSHVLPTGGAAAKFSGLTVEDFRRRTSIIEYTEADLRDALPVIETFGAIEGLDAHARSATIRFGAGAK
ncbi:MAG: histidinol dehydrogenase [Kiritimatiellae bacterium]|nr:histidinol dehydrogenase [Kiritimatiellia bacterium]